MGDELTKDSNHKKRIVWIDCAKGIGMLLVIIGHTMPVSGTGIGHCIRGIIFSFHMPLFFILSCLTFQFSENSSQFTKKTKRAYRHLIIPAIILYLLRIVEYIVKSHGMIEWKSYVFDRVITLVFSSGVDISLLGNKISAFGMMWYLIVLFLGRCLYDFIHLKIKKSNHIVIVVFLLSMVGVFLGRFLWLPLCLDIVFAVMILFFFGDCAKRIDFSKISLSLASFAIWISSFALIYYGYYDYLELAGRKYPMFPVCFIGAISGTVFISCLCKHISFFSWSKPLSYIGKNSLLLFCVHAMDYIYSFWWNKTNSSIINGFIRIIIDIVLTLILVRVNLLIRNVSKKSKKNGNSET